MKLRPITAAFAAGILAGCAASGVSLDAPEAPAAPRSVQPIVIDRGDLRIGTTVQFGRMPTVSEVNDLRLVYGLARVVILLPTWPEDITRLEPLQGLSEEAEVMVVVRGYPPSRSAAEAWNYVRGVRLVMIVPGPPVNPGMLDALNTMSSLERVIAEMDDPSRSGFERLQRPLGFRKFVD
jgi:hypothetical protein